MKYLKFKKEWNGRWYIDLPEWKGPKSDLEMVLGADTMLDILAQSEDTVNLSIDIKEFEGYQIKLDYLRNENGGSWYRLKSDYHDFEVWLCYVTEFVFDHFPNQIFISQ